MGEAEEGSWRGVCWVWCIRILWKWCDGADAYARFTPKRRVELDRRQWQSLLHHITVEALVLQKAKRPTGQVCYPRLADSNGWMHTRNATIKPSATGKGITVTFPDPNAELQILASIPKELMEGAQGLQDEDALFTEVEGAIAESGDRNITGQKPKGRLPPAWMDVSVSNPGLKIAVRTAHSQSETLLMPSRSSNVRFNSPAPVCLTLSSALQPLLQTFTKAISPKSPQRSCMTRRKSSDSRPTCLT